MTDVWGEELKTNRVPVNNFMQGSNLTRLPSWKEDSVENARVAFVKLLVKVQALKPSLKL